MDRRIAIFGAVLVAGCVGTRMDKGLSTLTGGTIQMAMMALGAPDGERTIAGQHIYYWVNDHQAMLFMNGAPFQAEAHCIIQLTVDERDVVQRWQYSGNPMGCKGYADALSR